MKAKYIPRIDIHDRYELKEALPLRTPYVIHIDPSDTCNFHCKFCPSGNLELMKKTKGRGHGPMPLDEYKRIIDRMQNIMRNFRDIRWITIDSWNSYSMIPLGISQMVFP